MSECSGHAVIFEASRRIHTFVLQQEVASGHADVLPDLLGLLKQGLSFADSDHHLRGREREELVKSPDPGELHGIEAVSPLGPELREAPGDGQAVPVVDHVEQITTERTREMGFVDGVGCGTGRMDALLECSLAGRRLHSLSGSSDPGHRSTTLVRNPDRESTLRVGQESGTGRSRRDLIIRSDNVNGKRPATLAANLQTRKGNCLGQKRIDSNLSCPDMSSQSRARDRGSTHRYH